MSPSDLLGAIHVLTSLASPRAARAAAAELPDHLAIADLLRAADGVQALARAASEIREPAEPAESAPSLYT